MKKYLLLVIFVFISQNVFAIERITVNGTRYDLGFVWDSLGYQMATLDQFVRDDQTREEKYDSNVDLCAELADKPAGCGTEPASEDFEPNGCSNPLPGYQNWNSTFNGDCNAHDRCYVDPFSTQSGCDSAFRANMDTTCYSLPADGPRQRNHQNDCYTKSAEYHMAVQTFGSIYFSGGQSTFECAAWHAIRKEYCNG